MQPFDVTGFIQENATEMFRTEVQITTEHAPGPRPRAYTDAVAGSMPAQLINAGNLFKLDAYIKRIRSLDQSLHLVDCLSRRPYLSLIPPFGQGVSEVFTT